MMPTAVSYAPDRSVTAVPISGRWNHWNARGKRLKPLALACLHLASPHPSLSDWRYRLALLCHTYSEGAVTEQLCRMRSEGYLTDGLPAVGYLTEKGRTVLRRETS